MEVAGPMQQIGNNIVQSMSEGLIVIDFEGTIRYVNPMAASMLGLEQEKMINEKFGNLFLMDPDNDAFTQAMLDTVYQRTGIQSRIVSYHTGGEVRTLRMTSSLFTKEDGTRGGITIVLSDLSELLELKDSLKAMEKISSLNQQLNERNELLSKTFGQFLSDDIVRELLESPGALEPGGKKRNVTVMMSDLRGFTSMCERMDASDLITMLNHYLATMTDIILNRNGTIIEFIGDGIMVIFGAPVQTDRHAENAVAAALEMQAAMEEVNRWNIERNYPRLEMGIGLNTGDMIVGIIGSESKKKYGVVGTHVNLCGRIESYTTGGQILVSPYVRESVSAELEIDKEMTVFPKGLDREMVLSQVTGIGAPYDIHITPEGNVPKKLKEPVPICFFRIEGKHITEQTLYGGITAVGDGCAFLETETRLELFDNIQINAGGRLLCKIMENTDQGYLIQYTSIPSGYDKWLKNYMEEAQ